MNYSDVLANARQCIGKYCKACPVCNGRKRRLEIKLISSIVTIP